MRMLYILSWECDGNGNAVIGMGGNRIEKVIPAHLLSAHSALFRIVIFSYHAKERRLLQLVCTTV